MKKPIEVAALTHAGAKRKNIPTAEFESVMAAKDKAPIRLAYERRDRDLDPQLVWRGKDGADWSDLIVQAPPLYIQEKVQPKVIIDDLRRQSRQRARRAPSSVAFGDAPSSVAFGDTFSPGEKGRVIPSPPGRRWPEGPDEGRPDEGAAAEWEVPREIPASWSGDAKAVHARFWAARIARQKEIDASIAAKAAFEYLYDKPYVDSARIRVAGPFTVESLSPHRTLAVDWDDELIDVLDAADGRRDSGTGSKPDFAEMILENLKAAGVQQAHKEDRITFISLTGWPGRYVCAEGVYEESGRRRRAGIFIGPEFGTVSRPDLVAAAREAGEADFDVLVACAFNYDAHSAEFDKLGRVPVLKARMNPDLHMGGELKATGAGNLFVIFGEPDIEVASGLWLVTRGGRLVVNYERVKALCGLADLEEINRALCSSGLGGAKSDRQDTKKHEAAIESLNAGDFPLTLTADHWSQVTVFGVDVFKPQTGEVVSEGTEGIALWMLDTDYNEGSFFVRHAYFLGANDPYKALKTTLKAEIDEAAWDSLHSAVSRPFPKPASGRIAVKVINHLGDEVMKVFAVD